MRANSKWWLLPVAGIALAGCHGGPGGGLDRANLVGNWTSTDDKGTTEWIFYKNDTFEITEHRGNGGDGDLKGRMDGTYKFGGDKLDISPLEVAAHNASRFYRQIYENELTRSRHLKLTWQGGEEFDAVDDNTGRTMHFVRDKKQ